MAYETKYKRLRARMEAITRFANSLQQHSDQYTEEMWDRGYEFAEVKISKKLRTLLSSLPTGYNEPNPSLKSQAKTRFLQWRENQAKGEWKTLSEAEKARWEGYVSEGVEFGTIRERELGLDGTLV